MNAKTDIRVSGMTIAAMLIIVSMSYAAIPAMGDTGSTPVIEWNEDEAMVMDLNNVLPIGWYNFTMEGAVHINWTLEGSILTMIPEENWYGSEHVTVTYALPEYSPIIYSIGGSREVSFDVILKVDPVNDPPQVSQSSISVEFNENEEYVVDLSQYFTDVDSTLTYSAETGSNLSISIDGSMLTIIPDQNWHGTSSLTVFATDGQYFAKMMIYCTVDPVQEYPAEGNAILVSMKEDTQTEIDLTDYIPPNWESISISSDNPSISFNINGVWLDIEPASNWNGHCNLSVDVQYMSWSDPQPPVVMIDNGNFTFGIDVDVKAVNDPPVALISRTPELRMSENTVQTIDVSHMFYDPDGDSLVFTASSSRNELRTDIDSNGTLTIEPMQGWYGEAKINIIAFDGIDSANITVDCQVIYSPEITMLEDVPDDLNLTQYLSPNVISLNVSVIQGNLDVSLNRSRGFLDICPAHNWNGKAVVELSGYYWTGPVAFDGKEVAVPNVMAYMVPFSERLDILVKAVDDPPIVKEKPGTLTTDEDTALTVPDIASYFEDVDSNLTFSVQGDSHVYVNIVNGALQIVPVKNWHGLAHIYVSASDGEYTTYLVIPVLIKSVDDPPVVLPGFDDIYTDEDTTAVLNLSAVFSDIDSTLNYTVSGDSDLSFEIKNNELFIKPAANWDGNSSFVITASDGTFNVSKEMTIHVVPVDDRPVARTSSYSLRGREDTPVEINLNSLFSDIDSTLTYTYTGGANLMINIDPQGIAHIVPDRNWNGDTTVYFIASDGEYTAKIPVRVHIAAVNDRPVHVGETPVLTLNRNETYTVDLSSYFYDPDGDHLTYTCSASRGVDVRINGTTATIEVTDNANPESSVVFFASDGNSSTSMEMHVISLPLSAESQTPPPELPDMTESSSGTSISPTMTYAAAIAAVGMAMMALAYAVMYLRPQTSGKGTKH